MIFIKPFKIIHFNRLIDRYHNFYSSILKEHFLILQIPSKLEEQLPYIDETGLQHYNAQWEFHTTPTYRMKYEDLEIKMKSVSYLGDILLYDCPEYVKNEFKNALNLYARGYWVASVALCGVIVEYLTKNYFQTDQSIHSKSEYLGISDRINLLYKNKIISFKMKKNLAEINHIRNLCIHLDTMDYAELSRKNTDSLNTLIRVLTEVSVIQYGLK